MSSAGKSFGTNSPPSEMNEEPLGVCSIRGDKARSLSDADQRRGRPRIHSECPHQIPKNHRIPDYCHSGVKGDAQLKSEKGVQVCGVREQIGLANRE